MAGRIEAGVEEPATGVAMQSPKVNPAQRFFVTLS
jgi:hypothetical protein